jgi:hypothetical protein
MKLPVAPIAGRISEYSDPAPARRRAIEVTDLAMMRMMTIPIAKENHAPFPAEPAMNMGVNAITALGAMFATLCASTSNGVTLRRAKPPE